MHHSILKTPPAPRFASFFNALSRGNSVRRWVVRSARGKIDWHDKGRARSARPTHWFPFVRGRTDSAEFLYISAMLLTLSVVTTGSGQGAAGTAPTAPVADEVPISLSVFEVTTTKDIGYQSMHAASATRTNALIADTPMNIAVYNQQFLEDINASLTNDVMDYVPGVVALNEDGGYLSRGSNSVGANYLNGFAQTTGYGSESVANIERIEVIRGPDAILYGSGAYGGSFNRVTKRPKPVQETNVRTTVGGVRGHASVTTSFDNTGPVPIGNGKRFQYRLSAVWDDSTTYFGGSYREKALGPTVTWNVAPNTKLTVMYLRGWQQRQAHGQTPVVGGNVEGIIVGNGTLQRFGKRNQRYTIPEDFRRNLRQVSGYDLTHAFTPALQFRSEFQYEVRDQQNTETVIDQQAMTILADAALMPRYWRDQPRLTRNYKARNELYWNVKTGPVHHRLLAGQSLTEQYDRTQQSNTVGNWGGIPANNPALTDNGRHANSGATRGVAWNFFPTLTLAQFIANPRAAGYNTNLILPINVINPADSPAVPPVAQRSPVYLASDAKTVVQAMDYFINDHFSMANERLFFVLGVRQSQTTRSSTNFVSGTFPFMTYAAAPTRTEVVNKATTGSGGAVWHLNARKTLSLYVSAQNGFTPVFNLQADGSPLKPQTSFQKEVGIKFSLLEGRLQGVIDGYHNQLHNVVVADPSNPGYFLQQDGVINEGLEFTLNTRLTDNWSSFGGFAYIQAADPRTKLAQYMQPKHSGTLFNRYAFSKGPLKGFSVSLGTIYSGSRDIQISTSGRTAITAGGGQPIWHPPAYWRVDAIAGYRFKAGKILYDVTFKAKNLTDNVNMFLGGSQNYRYLNWPGREYQGTLGAKF
ncbi:MAG: hypothetical protein EXS37_09285 [Opitutus sp.]|nr:hypothetical protein [Opitutus sp.]